MPPATAEAAVPATTLAVPLPALSANFWISRPFHDRAELVGDHRDRSQMVGREVAHGDAGSTAARGRVVDPLRDQPVAHPDIEVPLDGAAGARHLFQADAGRGIGDVERRLARAHLADARVLAIIVEGDRRRAPRDRGYVPSRQRDNDVSSEKER